MSQSMIEISRFCSTTDLAMIICCSSGRLGAVVASLIPAVNVVNMLLLGSGIWKDEATVKSMTRHGDHRYVRALVY